MKSLAGKESYHSSSSRVAFLLCIHQSTQCRPGLNVGHLEEGLANMAGNFGFVLSVHLNTTNTMPVCIAIDVYNIYDKAKTLQQTINNRVQDENNPNFICTNKELTLTCFKAAIFVRKQITRRV